VTVYARNAAVEAAPLKDESVLFHPATNRFCMLNKTMAFIWSKLEHRSTVDEISAEITRNFAGVTDGEARDDVKAALTRMLELDLLVTIDGDA
jgi:hypothetical protein